MLYHRVAVLLFCFLAFSLVTCSTTSDNHNDGVERKEGNDNLRSLVPEQDPGDESVTKSSISANTQGSLITAYVSSITPFSVDLTVSVPRSSDVECSLVDQENALSVETEPLSKKQHISKLALMRFTGLKPKSSYTVSCTALPLDDESSPLKNRPFIIMTQDVYFEIRRLHRWRRSISYKVASNVKYPIACYLMDKKPNVIDTFESSTAINNNVIFTVPSAHTAYLTKCEMYDSKNNLLLSTSVEEIHPIISFWKVFGIILIISTLSWVAYILWNQRIIDDPSISIIRRTDTNPSFFSHQSEFGRTARSIETDILLDESIKPVVCKRCGFTNHEKSVVCKECNSLLKGNDFFQAKQKEVYY